jgi:hypothetical protein
MVKMLFLLIVFRFACSDVPKNKTPFGRPQGAKNPLGKPAMPRLNPTQKVIGKLPASHPDGKQAIYRDGELRGLGIQCSG